MGRIFKRKSEPVQEPNSMDMAATIEKIQQQLAGLEAKIDILLSKSSGQPRPGNFPRHDNPRHFDRGHHDRVLTKVICAECGNECEVPFKPSGDRPVYCKECFAKRREGGGGGAFKDKFDHRPREEKFGKFRNFDKPQAREKRSSGSRKKPPFRKRR